MIKKALTNIFIAIFLCFLAPLTINIGITFYKKNDNILLLAIGAILGILAILFFFRGIKKLLKGLE